MPNWNTFNPSEIEYDDDHDKLGNHALTIEEAIQCFSREFIVRRNKTYPDRYKLFGKTDGGKTVCLIFQLKKQSVVRIITGWEI